MTKQEIENRRKEIEALNVSFASMSDNFKKLQTNMTGMEANEEMRNAMNSLWNVMYEMVANVRKQIYSLQEYLWDYQANHSKGHLPPIKSASQMSKALKACGMEDDYEVGKGYVYTASTKGAVLELNYKK